MRACVLSIGTEVTRGELVNTNANWLAARLTHLGFEVTRIDCCDDDIDRVGLSLRQLANDHAVLVSTGGLGPTTDDLTTEAVGKVIGKKLVRDNASLEDIEEKFRRFGRVMAPSNAKQADFPEGAAILPNVWGTAPGFSVNIGACRAFFLPGVPREMQPIFDTHIAPVLMPLAPSDQHQIRLLTYGKPESEVGELLAGVEVAFPGVTIGYRAHFPEIEVKVLARGEASESLAKSATVEVEKRLGDIVIGRGDVRFPDIVAAALRAKKLSLALAESCTGGLVAELLTAQPASDFFLGSIVVYANAAKEALLDVPAELLAKYGAVSPECASAMANGARSKLNSDIAVSITGIAGPTGGTEQKPVGTVHMAVSTATETKAYAYKFRGDRFRIQRHAAYQAQKLIVLCANAFQR